jgi:pimeloyl-ACP methyl ester carboxylesterase
MTAPTRPSLRRSRLWLLVIAAVLAVVAAVPARAALAGGSNAEHPKARPTVVLVHGAWADGSSWSGVVRRLQARGYTVSAPPNPLRGLASDAAYLATYLKTITGPIVLAGHSYGGAVITNAALSDPGVKALVYVDAFAPDTGETVPQLAGPDSALAVDPTTIFNFVPATLPPTASTDAYLEPSVFHAVFAADLSSGHAAVLAATQRPAALGILNERSGAPAWRKIPSWYLVGTQDRVIPPAQQLFMARRARAHIVEVKASHVSLISRPGAVANLIVRAARSIH